MSEKFKYAKNGTCRFENFAEHLAADDFSKVYLGKLCDMKWYFELRIIENGTKIYPVIYSDNDYPRVKHSVQVFFELKNHSKQNQKNFKRINKEVLKFDKASGGFDAPILEILDLKNGWLDDGTLSFEYGIQVEAIMENKIWRFNFYDKLFNAGAEQVQFDRVDDPNTVGPLYAQKLLLHFHSEKIAKQGNYSSLKWTDEGLRGQFIDLLQLCHGVRLHLRNEKFGQILADANVLKMFNVISYCDWYFVQTKTWESMRGCENGWILFANKCNLRHFLAFMLKSMMSLEEFVSEENVEKMFNEFMKMFVAKFLYEKF